MRKIIAGLAIAALTHTLATADVIEKKVLLDKARAVEVASALSVEFAGLKSHFEVVVDAPANAVVIKAHPSVASLAARKAHALDVESNASPASVIMEFSVIEKETDGSSQVVAAPRILTQAGQEASIRVRQDDRGMNLTIQPKPLEDGNIHLQVECRSWRIAPDDSGRRRIHTRAVENEVVVASGKRVTLESGSGNSLTLELEAQAI